MGCAVFRDLATIEHLEAVAFKNPGSAPCFEGHHLTIDLAYVLAAQMIQITVHQLGAMGKALSLGQNIEMEVGTAAGSLRNLFPRSAQDPADEVTRSLVVEGVLGHPAREKMDVVEEVEELLAEGTVGAEQITLHNALLFQHEGRLRLDVGVVARQVVGENLAILEDRVDRLTQKSGLAAEMAHGLAIT